MAGVSEPSRSGEGVEALADLAEKAARLAKADLVTEMVGEFPELQGVMGGYYAAKEGLPREVSDAIRDHYKPVGQGDDVPTAPVTVAVSLADKLDTLVGFFTAGESPTGSKDPFALRRSSLGIIATILVNNRVSLGRLIARAAVILWDANDHGVPADVHAAYRNSFEAFDWSDSFKEITISPDVGIGSGGYWKLAFTSGMLQLPIFFADRLKVQQKEAGVRHDLIDAVFALGGEDDLVRLLARVKALQSFIGTEDGANLLAGYKRAANLLAKSEPSGAVRVERSRDTGGQDGLSTSLEANGGLVAEEQALLAALNTAEPKAKAAVEAEDFEGAMAALATLRAPVDAFFDAVMVNDPDPEIRAFRLGLLARVRDAVHAVADFSKIEG